MYRLRMVNVHQVKQVESLGISGTVAKPALTILFYVNFLTYSRCQKYESSPIFVKKLNIRLYPEFLSNQIRTFGPQIRSLGTQTCTLCSTIASNIFALTFLPHLLATLVNLVLYIHGH